MTDNKIEMTDSPSNDFSNSDKIGDISSPDIAVGFYPAKTTAGYKCGKCCGSCCTTKYTFCSKSTELRACTPFTTAEIGSAGFGVAGAAVGAGTACTAMCSLMCSTCCHNARDQSCVDA